MADAESTRAPSVPQQADAEKRRLPLESDMSPAVSAWLAESGYSVYAEVEGIDHVGVRWPDKHIICVEMKRSLSSQVMRQAHSRFVYTDSVFVCVPRHPKPQSIARLNERGIGLLVNGKPVFCPSRTRSSVYGPYRDRLLEKCRRSTAGGIGGLPTLKGVGPAISVAAAVAAYLKGNPKATWDQIFRDVPNHYCHARSMCGAMRFHDLTGGAE